MPGTNTLVNQGREDVTVTGVYFRDDKVVLVLSDEREIALPMKHIKRLAWLYNASEKQRAHWSIEPHGYAVYWDELDDGIEVAHALSTYRMHTVGAQELKITFRGNRNGQGNGRLGHTAVRSTGNPRRVRALSSKP